MEDNIKELIGSRIKERRIFCNKTQEELGNSLHVKKQTISKYEKGINAPGAEELKILSTVLDCSVDYLVGKTDKPSTQVIEYTDKELGHIEIGMDNYPYKLTPQEVEEMIETLKNYHFNVEALIEDMRNKEKDNNK